MEEDQASHFAAHLDTCAECLAVVSSLAEESDTVVGLVQSAEADYSSEPEFRQLSDRLASPGSAELSQWFPSFDSVPLSSVDGPAELPNPLDDYLLLEPLGRGSMGRAYKAQHQRLKRTFAIKVLAPKYGHAKDLVARFEREMQAIGTLSHPNIVAATDAGEDQGHHYLVMEYVDGLDLQTILRRLGPLAVPDACEAMRQACLGLQAAHEQGLVHRDVKPSNLLLWTDGVVKVLDLGLVALAADPHRKQRANPVGTAPYMAPEQWRGHPVDIRADVYSAGCTLFKLLTGKAPFEHERATMTSFRQSHCEDPPPKITDWNPGIPNALATVLARTLAKDRERRFASPAELSEALSPFTEGADLATLVPRARRISLQDTLSGATENTLPLTLAELGSPARPRWRARRVWISLGLVAVAALAALTAISSWRDDSLQWRPLGIREAQHYWSSSGFQAELRPAPGGEEAALSVNAVNFSLVTFGVAPDDTYALRTAFDPTRPNPAGFFFGAEQTPTLLTFHVVQVRELDPEPEGAVFHIDLRHHRLESRGPGPWSHAQPQITSALYTLPPGTDNVQLELRLSAKYLDILLEDQLAIDIPRSDLENDEELVAGGHFGVLTHNRDVTFLSNAVLDLEEKGD